MGDVRRLIGNRSHHIFNCPNPCDRSLCCCRVDPFAKDSPLKAMPVLEFPPDFFFVLRVIQLLR